MQGIAAHELRQCSHLRTGGQDGAVNTADDQALEHRSALVAMRSEVLRSGGTTSGGVWESINKVSPQLNKSNGWHLGTLSIYHISYYLGQVESQCLFNVSMRFWLIL